MVSCSFVMNCRQLLCRMYRVSFSSIYLPTLMDYLSNAQVEDRLKSLLAYMAWLLWQGCDDRICNQVHVTYAQELLKLISQAIVSHHLNHKLAPSRNWDGCSCHDTGFSPLPLVAWLHPLYGAIKIKFDVSVHSFKSATVIRDYYVRLLIVGDKLLSSSSISFAELTTA